MQSGQFCVLNRQFPVCFGFSIFFSLSTCFLHLCLKETWISFTSRLLFPSDLIISTDVQIRNHNNVYANLDLNTLSCHLSSLMSLQTGKRRSHLQLRCWMLMAGFSSTKVHNGSYLAHQALSTYLALGKQAADTGRVRMCPRGYAGCRDHLALKGH